MKLGLTVGDVRDILTKLSVWNYSKVPDKDEAIHNHDTWVFGYQFDGIELYIKVTLAQGDGSAMQVVVISFHEAQYPITYPFGDQP